MDIASTASVMQMAQIQMAAGYAVAGKAKDTFEQQAAGLIEMMKTTVPSFGHKLDIRV